MPRKRTTEIRKVRYGKTINIGDYESIRIDLEADVPEGGYYEDVLADLENELLILEKKAKKSGCVQ